MTLPPIKEDPVTKFRKLLASFSPISRLPKMNEEPPTVMPKQENNKMESLPKKKDTPAVAASKLPPNLPRASKPNPPPTASKPDPQPAPAPKERTSTSIFGPRFWTAASIISLAGNVILTIVLIVLAIGVSRMGMSVSYLMGLGNQLLGLPGGLYANFEKMDRASIQTNVEVNTTIPVKFDLQLNQQTNVVLSQDVTITNALVTVNTGGLNISRANTTIVLPQGTSLPVFLNLTVPVDTQVPVTLNVPVNIPLSGTELHEPFVGLQDVIRPLYCALNKQAVNLDGQPICP